ncbi:TolB family protein [Bacillus suaedae]|uniref:PD40 domain-containing protein n=1 Tax=Halalkalibacter suaedae TaxID=2822140 RepID=A0A940WSY7_9BACI|nr:DPP IV N-terminal domain-containing protein [Bacillus suaedae]MBP3951920.1 PD40 domain-containing protein [Bacillus suaedae]
MRNKQRLLSVCGIVFVILVVSILYELMSDPDSYRFYTGIGSGIDVSEDGTELLFSYYQEGSESIYLSDLDGANVQQLTNADGERHRQPKYSGDGESILYLNENEDGIQSIVVANKDGSEPRQVTERDQQVTEAIFSPDGNHIYYSAIPSKDFGVLEGTADNGYDLYSVDLTSNEVTNLTSQDYFTLSALSVSSDGKTIYFSLFEGEKQELFAYNLGDGTVRQPLPQLPELYSPMMAKDQQTLAYTAVAGQSEDSLFEYELFLYDVESDKTKQVTQFGTQVSSPVFFKGTTELAFLEQTNWPDDPSEFQPWVMDLETETLNKINLQLPEEQKELSVIQIVDGMINGVMIASLYVLLFSLLTVYSHFHLGKAFLPTIISGSLTVLLLGSSFVIAAMIDPWLALAIGVLAGALFVCTVLILIFTVVFRFLMKRRLA